MAMLSGIQEIDQEIFMTMLRFNIKSGGNLMSFGPAGIGKTEMAIQACEEQEYQHVYLNLSVLEAPDLMGLPMVDESGPTPVSRYALPSNFPRRDTKQKPVVLLVDEADKAKPELQNPMLELFQFRSINGVPLNIHSVIATGNLPDEGAFSQPMSHALMNRCLVYRVTHSYEPWQEWAVKAGVNPLIVGFLGNESEYLLKPPNRDDETAYCHPSPRAWTMAARDIDKAGMDSDIDLLSILVSGRVGIEASVKFKVWLEHYRHIEPLIRELVQKGTIPKLESGDIGRVLVCAIASVDAVMKATRSKPKDIKTDDEHIKYVHKVLKNITPFLAMMPGEIQIAAVKSVLDMSTIQKFKFVEEQSFVDIYSNIRKAMKST